MFAFDFLGGEGSLAVFAEIKLDLPVLFLAGAALDDVFAGAIDTFLHPDLSDLSFLGLFLYHEFRWCLSHEFRKFWGLA